MIKVCHMTSAHKSNDIRIFWQECSSLSSFGYDVYLVAQGASREENGIKVIGVGQPPRSRLERMLSFSKKIYSVSYDLDCDVYHFHDPELLPYGVKLKKKGKIVIFDSHENHAAQILERTYLPAWSRKIVSKLYELYEKHAVAYFDAVISPCTFNGKNIFDGKTKRTKIIANYSKLDEYYSLYNPSAQKEGYICYTGTLSEANGVTDLVLASYKAGIPLVLAGMPSDYTEKLQSMKEFENVKYEGFVDHNRIIEILQHATIGAYINRHVGQNGMVDTFGIKVYEFMAMGLPVIVDETIYAKEIIKKYNCGICVPPENVEKIVNAIEYLTKNPEVAYQMGQNGRNAVVKVFNWSTQERELKDLYHDVLGKNNK